jgi:hypothetical protein
MVLERVRNKRVLIINIDHSADDICKNIFINEINKTNYSIQHNMITASHPVLLEYQNV